MTEYHKTQASIRYFIDGKNCLICGKALRGLGDGMAHVIPQKKYLLKKYGAKIIHHNMNLRPSCMRCNSKWLIEGKPHKMNKLIQLIIERGDEYLTVNEIEEVINV